MIRPSAASHSDLVAKEDAIAVNCQPELKHKAETRQTNALTMGAGFASNATNASSSETENWLASLQNIRDAATKMREIKDWAHHVTQNAYALINQASEAARAADDRACHAEAALSAAVTRAEQAEKLVQALTAKMATANQEPVTRLQETPLKAEMATPKSVPPVARPATIHSDARAGNAIGKVADIRTGEVDTNRRSQKDLSQSPARNSLAKKTLIKSEPHYSPSHVAKKNSSFSHRNKFPDFRNENEFDSITYQESGS